jgi:predicted DNA-binding protein (MmcQ/YjbR family)
MNKEQYKLSRKIIKHLSSDLLLSKYKEKNKKNPLFGHCYVASETAYHLFAKKAGYKSFHLFHELSSHWFLKNNDDKIIDLTADQFSWKPPYHLAKRKAFLTNKPSKRAKILMKRIKNDIK